MEVPEIQKKLSEMDRSLDEKLREIPEGTPEAEREKAHGALGLLKLELVSAEIHRRITDHDVKVLFETFEGIAIETIETWIKH